MANIDVSGFNIPETPYREMNPALSEFGDRMMQQRHYQYQLQKDREADEWRKMNLIQDLTDLSKHQTSSDVANAIGNTVAGNVLQKYTELAKNMSPTELQANIQREMGSVMNGMDATRNELDNTDEALKVLKQAHPELDISSLAKDLRADVLGRRINHDSFINPLEVQPSQVQLDSPDFLSRYVTHTKGLDDEIQNPKGLDPTTVVSGDPYTNVEYSAKVPTWMQANYDESKMKDGFLPKGFMPRLNIKSEELPTDFLPALKGQQRKIVTHDVWQDFASKHPLQLIAGTRQMFPNYDQMSEGEKELAQRDYLFGKISSLDKSQFSYKSSKTPSVSQQKFWINPSGSKSGGSNNGELNINDVYKQIDDWASSVTPGHGAALNQLPANTQAVVLKFARDLTGNNQLGQESVYVKKDENGKLVVRGIKDEAQDRNNLKQSDTYTIGTLDYTGTNLKQQPSVKEKRAVIEKGKQKKDDPLGIFD